ncbi:MAG: UDP-N-acetylmuramate dehydrogenase [Cellvibrio sp.]
MALFIPEFNLQKFNTLAVPATAAWYLSVTSHDDLLQGLIFAKERQLPLLVLGGGSNVILPSRFDGLVLHMQTKGVELVDEDEQHVLLKVAAGEIWHDFVMASLASGYFGLENLALIPGSVGAAPIQNIGAYGVEVDAFINEVHAVEISSKTTIIFTNDACQFGYRDSFFKRDGLDRYLITHVVFRLLKQPKLVLGYPELAKYFASDEPTPIDVAEAVIAIRRSKLPDPAETPNVGSFFKNPIVESSAHSALVERFPLVPSYPQADGRFKIAAGWLIDQAGWKGREQGGARVHERQALVLTNPYKSDSGAVLRLARAIADDVFQQFGIALEIEPRVYSTGDEV